SNTAIFDKGTTNTGESGTATFSLTNTTTENFTVTVNAQGSTASTNVKFIGSSGDVTILDTNVTNNNQLANGSDKIRIDVVAKDRNGNLIGGVPIAVRMSAGIAAKAEPAQGATDINGSFFTEISSTEAGNVNITIATNNIAETQTIAFQASNEEIIPTTIDFQVTNNSQLANGEDKINLVVIPRDASNNPLVGVNIRLIADASDVVIEPDSGTTNEIGKFFATVTSSREQKFDITAVVEGLAEPKGIANLIFRAISGDVKELNISVIKDNQLATGQDADSAQINVIARDVNGLPVSGVPINVQLLDNPAAIVQFDSPFTDANGLFVARITSTSAGKIKAKITVAGVNPNVPSRERTITFIASNEINPAKVEIGLEGSLSPAVNSIATLLVVPRDKNNAPIPNLEVSLASNSGTVVFEPDKGTTNQLGELRVNITNSTVETVEVTATAKGVNSEKLPITFGSGVGGLVVTVFNDNQLANGADMIEVHVVARDNAGM
ncbi:MAG: Ig-like domain-containing protein, partial [Proteobacteria bacterium]|nr:Ig-like domain-containing protein [Pseudomonadota bacterium]